MVCPKLWGCYCVFLSTSNIHTFTHKKDMFFRFSPLYSVYFIKLEKTNLKSVNVALNTNLSICRTNTPTKFNISPIYHNNTSENVQYIVYMS